MSHCKAPKCCCKYFSIFFSVYLNYCDLGAYVQVSVANMSYTSEPSGAEEFCDKSSSDYAERGGISVSHPEFVFLFTKFSQVQNLYYIYDT